jgi:hypothetical protein
VTIPGVRCDHDVGGGQVAEDDAALVAERDGVGELQPYPLQALVVGGQPLGRQVELEHGVLGGDDQSQMAVPHPFLDEVGVFPLPEEVEGADEEPAVGQFRQQVVLVAQQYDRVEPVGADLHTGPGLAQHDVGAGDGVHRPVDAAAVAEGDGAPDLVPAVQYALRRRRVRFLRGRDGGRALAGHGIRGPLRHGPVRGPGVKDQGPVGGLDQQLPHTQGLKPEPAGEAAVAVRDDAGARVAAVRQDVRALAAPQRFGEPAGDVVEGRLVGRVDGDELAAGRTGEGFAVQLAHLGGVDQELEAHARVTQHGQAAAQGLGAGP